MHQNACFRKGNNSFPLKCVSIGVIGIPGSAKFPGHEVINFVMLNSTEHKIYHAHKIYNCWHFNIYWHDKDNTLELESKKSLFFDYSSFYEQLKFHAQLN